MFGTIHWNITQPIEPEILEHILLLFEPRCSTRTVAKIDVNFFFYFFGIAILRTVLSNFCHRLEVRQVLSTLSAKNTPPATDWIASQIQRDQKNVIDSSNLL